jgi:hypothetical protein
MALRQGLTTSFKKEILLGEHNLETDTLKIALYTALATLDENTTVYTTTNEISGTGYTAGGETLVNVSVSTSGLIAYVSFDNVVWDPASFTARGALIYNESVGNKSIAILDFGSDKTTTTKFTIDVPPDTPTAAIIRIT